MNRKRFLQSIIGASTFLASPLSLFGNDQNQILDTINQTKRKTKGTMFGFKVAPIKKVRVGIIGLGNRGSVLLQMFKWLVENELAEIIALSDIDIQKLTRSKERLKKWQRKSPKIYNKNKNDWKNLVKQDNIDLVLVSTPWRYHTEMAIYSMNQGKHVATEVPMAYTLMDCWELIETAEKTQRHCMLMENCNYNKEELFVLNMIEQGVFGDITHAEGAYLHDLRKHMLSSDYYQDQWRLKQHISRNGNFYTTHGLGPISFYLKIGRGDTFSHLTSMSSRELNLSQSAKRVKSKHSEFKCGDMNTTLIKTEKGKTIMLQFDVHTGRPYSRINKVVGTKATHDGYPSRLYIDDGSLQYSGHHWLKNEDYKTYSSKYEHPIIEKLKTVSEDYKLGHGGMDFVMIYRLIRSLNLGLPLDINVYDSVMWSAVTPLSEISVASNSLSIPFPDFTNGVWEKEKDLEIMKLHKDQEH